MLNQLALAWKWPSPAETPAAARTPVTAGSASAATPVTAIDRTRTDTRELFKDAREALLVDPKNVTARTNYILLALLTGQSADSARQLARSLYREHPENPTAVACYGLALFNEGRAGEAIAAMEKLSPEQLREPLTALYYGHLLAGSKLAENSARAPEFLALAEKVPLLPEERAFLRVKKE
jgi:predicted Zn-dependent protease